MGQHRLGARWSALLLSSFFLGAFAQEASAQTWTGAGADNNWSTGANWTGGVAPASGATTSVTFPFSASRFDAVVDAPWTVNQLNFNSSPPYTFTGQPITLAGAAPGVTIAEFPFRPIAIGNPIVLTGPATITTNIVSAIRFTGGIGGIGPLAVTGGGSILLAGTNTYGGGTSVTTGGLVLEGSLAGPVTVDHGGIIGGPGTVNGPVVVTNTGSIDMGALASFDGFRPSILGTGDLTLAGGYWSLINGTAQGTQYGTVRVTGTVNLTGARLEVSVQYWPVAGDTFTIIENDGADPVIGTFDGLPEGATFQAGFRGPMRISYVGGTGNDVTLTALSSTPGASSSIPTLSQHALLLLAGMVLAIGMLTRAGRR